MYRFIASHVPHSGSRLFAALLGMFLLSGALGLVGCGDDDPAGPGEPPTNTGFTLGYELANWSSSGITGGTTNMALVAGTREEEAHFTYSVNLGNPGTGVSARVATFSVPATKSGTVTVAWTYTGYHAFYAAYAQLTFFASQGDGVEPQVVVGVPSQAAGGGFGFSGTTTLTVVEGEDFGFTVGGSNYDSDSRLNGDLHITRMTTPL